MGSQPHSGRIVSVRPQAAPTADTKAAHQGSS